MKTDVVIPARDEDTTIGNIVECLADDPKVGQIIVACDSCTDGTNLTAVLHGATLVLTKEYGGKGQAVTEALEHVMTEYVMFMDADYTGFTEDHISAMLCGCPGMTIGVPDIPRDYPSERLWAWPWCSGIRVVPTYLPRQLRLHGYLMETQINLAAKHAVMPHRFRWLRGLKAPWNMSERRLTAMENDAKWGKEHGIL